MVAAGSCWETTIEEGKQTFLKQTNKKMHPGTSMHFVWLARLTCRVQGRTE
jgi:hypothetical protein